MESSVKVQRIRLPNSDQFSWSVLSDGYLPVRPIEQFITYLESIERSPNTIRSYAYHLKLYWEFLRDTSRDWITIGISDLADFVSYLRNPLPGVTSLQQQESRRTEATVNLMHTRIKQKKRYSMNGTKLLVLVD